MPVQFQKMLFSTVLPVLSEQLADHTRSFDLDRTTARQMGKADRRDYLPEQPQGQAVWFPSPLQALYCPDVL